MYYAPLSQALPTAMDDVAPVDVGPSGALPAASVRVGPSPAGVGSMSTTAVIIGGLALVGIWAALRLGRKGRP